MPEQRRIDVGHSALASCVTAYGHRLGYQAAEAWRAREAGDISDAPTQDLALKSEEGRPGQKQPPIFLPDDSATEYAVIAASIAVVTIAAVANIGRQIQNVLSDRFQIDVIVIWLPTMR
jgi:hypothetical protein